MAAFALALSTPSLTRPPLPALPAKPRKRSTILYSASFKSHQPPARCCRSRLPSFIKAECERGLEAFSQLFPNQTQLNSKTVVVPEFWEQCQRFITTTALGASMLMVAFPANATVTEENLPDFLDAILLSVICAFLYLIGVPLLLYYYLYKRWFKRRMAEAILQFGLVFLFFPGMLILAPFINMRQFPREGVKEPWDEIRPL